MLLVFTVRNTVTSSLVYSHSNVTINEDIYIQRDRYIKCLISFLLNAILFLGKYNTEIKLKI